MLVGQEVFEQVPVALDKEDSGVLSFWYRWEMDIAQGECVLLQGDDSCVHHIRNRVQEDSNRSRGKRTS